MSDSHSAVALPVGRPTSRPTMRDVAALARVSLKTVSRVINAVDSVDPVLADRVRLAAGALSYRPNLTASNLRRGGRTATIGMLVEDASNPFSAILMRAVENVARPRGVLVLIGSLDGDPERERLMTSALIDRRVDGLVIVPSSRDHRYLLREQQAGVHLVFLDRGPHHLHADSVFSDNKQGALRAVQHLLAAGHRRIAYLGDRTHIATARDRFAGWERALELARIPRDATLIRHDLYTEQASMQATKSLLASADPPTALFTSQNLITIAATRVLRAADLHERIAVVGFDDFSLADLLQPAITVIAQDVGLLGESAAQLLFDRLDGDRSPTKAIVIPTRLIVRGSGEIPP